MKKIMSPAMVAHTWAHQLETEASNSGRSFYFEGKSIYSYGRHFEIARFFDEDTILFTKRGYSNTTAKHISYVRGAIPHNKKVVYVPDPGNYPSTNLEAWQSSMNQVLKNMEKARKKEKYFEAFQSLKNEAEVYMKLTKVKPSKEFKKLLSYTFDDALKFTEKNIEAKKKHEKLVMTKGKKLYDKYLALWRKFASSEEIYSNFTPAESALCQEFSRTMQHDRIRVNGEVVTSKGVKMPIDVAKRYLKQWEEGLITKGSQVLNFTVDEVSDFGIVIGCHRIPKSEIEYLKTQIQ